jgi:anion-transporting  ArsA/GET3 family ATPase
VSDRFAARLAGLRVVVCAGAGGVGKTTVAATIGLGLAASGQRVALVTIDPARRLAEAMGLDELDNRPQRVAAEPFAESGLPLKGELWAMMLDVKRTFDELVTLLAPDPRTGEQILANRVYQQLSSAVAGSQDYTAMAKLFELDEAGGYDAIVLDTPPSRSAVDFLTAPQRLDAFLTGRALRLLLRPPGALFRMAGLVTGALRRIVGAGMLDDLTGFFVLMSGLVDGFHRRAVDVQDLLERRSTGFVVVTSPEDAPIREACYLAAQLREMGLHRSALVVNRLHPVDPIRVDSGAVAERLNPVLGRKLAERVVRGHTALERLAHREAAAVARLEDALSDADPARLRDRAADVHDAPALVALHEELFGSVESSR